MWSARVRTRSLIIAFAAAVSTVAACGQIDPDSPTGPSSVPSSTNPPAAAPAPAPAPSPAPAPAPPPSSAVGRVQVTINPNPVPYSGQPITDVASCRDRPHTWFYEQVLRETGGVAVTVTGRVDSFDGAAGASTNPNLHIAANGSTTVRTRWCSSTPSAHTAQTNFSGTDANGKSWNVTGVVVRLNAR